MRSSVPECASCARPMKSAGDHGGADAANTWCSHCCHADGSRRPRREILNGLKAWLQSEACARAGFPRAASDQEAHSRAAAILSRGSAWR